MNLKIAKEICRYQGIKLSIEVTVICPFCNIKSMRLQIEDNKAYCTNCGKNTTIEEMYKLAEESWLDEHKSAFWNSRKNQGVGY